MVNHYGTLKKGHYTAYIKNGGEWFEMDDSKVRRLKDDNGVCSNANYVLFYEK